MITLIGGVAGHIFGGAVLLESVFGWPGLGQYALQAIERNPCPQISVLVSYPIVRNALFTVFSDMGFQGLASPANTVKS